MDSTKKLNTPVQDRKWETEKLKKGGQHVRKMANKEDVGPCFPRDTELTAIYVTK